MDKLELSKLRTIPLELVMASFKAEPDPADIHNWRTPAGRVSVNGDKFYNHDSEQGGGGAIDLASHLGSFGFRESIAYLGKLVGQEATLMQYLSESEKHVKRILDSTKVPTVHQEIPRPDASKLNRVRSYLVDKRAIPDAVVEKAITRSRLWADSFGNAVFSLSDPNLSGAQVGAELRGTHDKPFHGVRGEKKGMFFTGNAKTLVAAFVESGIEALSYEALFPNSALVISTTGSSKETLIQTAGLLKQKGFHLISAFNNDKDGDRYAATLENEFGKTERRIPDGGLKDWNLMLQKKRDAEKIQSASQQKVAPKTEPKKIRDDDLTR